MINPTENRLDFAEILSPPSNYKLDFAIGTTYSLDLKALIGALISLNLSEEMDSNLTNNSIFLLRTLRESTDNVALFCEGGQIHLSNKPNKLYVLLEDTVFEVKTSKEFQKNKFASFHPKFWLLRFINPDGGDFLYRLIVLSRNLTFDNSWDITFAMDGKQVDESTKDKNEPIISFIKYLTEFSTNKEKTKLMKEIINDLNHVHFDLESNEFNDYKFILNGVDNQKYSIQNESLFAHELDDLLIMSPFLATKTIQGFNSRKNPNSKAILITQQDSLEILNKLDCSNFEVYILREEIINGESQINEDSQFDDDLEFPPSHNIHAKIYIVGNDAQIDLYLGSLNASENALYNNVEFMIKLSANNKKLAMEKLINDIFNGDFGGPNDPFKLVDVDDFKNDKDSQSNLNLVVKYLARLNPKAEIISNGETKYDVKLTFNDPDWEFLNGKKIFISPLFTYDKSKFSTLMKFKGLEKTDLSVFYEVLVIDELNEFKSIIKIKTDNMPEDRDKEVISNIFEDKTDFYTYVSFMFDDNYVLAASEWDNFKKSGSKSFYTQLSGLYEKMLKAACINKDKFKDLDSLIQDVSEDDVVPEEFKKLYDAFMEVIEDESE